MPTPACFTATTTTQPLATTDPLPSPLPSSRLASAMTEKLDSPAVNSGRPYMVLPPTLAQLVEDRFDEDQYEQAVALLDQVLTQGLRPSAKTIQRLMALSLCSLAPGQLASTSRWTLDDHLHDIASGLYAHTKRNNGEKRDLKNAASSTSEGPPPEAVVKATSLLHEYASAAAAQPSSGQGSSSQLREDRTVPLTAHQILESLPSRRKPLSSSRSGSPRPSRQTRRGSVPSDGSGRDESFEQSSVERWISEHLLQAEDIWDLLCGRQFSAATTSKSASLTYVYEFWMNASQRKRFLKQLQSADPKTHRLEDKLRELERKKKTGEKMESLSSDSDQDSDSDDDLPSLSIPGRGKKGPASPKGRRGLSTASPSPKKRPRTDKPSTSQRDDDETGQNQLQMTEGAWRTLAALVALWERTTPPALPTDDGQASASKNSKPPLLWQFPRSHLARKGPRGLNPHDATDDIDRALDLAFSFPRILPAFTPPSAESGKDYGLFDKAASNRSHGHKRLLSSVPQAELKQRQTIGEQRQQQWMAARAETAARLLSLMYELVKQGYIQSGVFTEGVSDRLEALDAVEIQYIILPLLCRQPSAVASVLASHLEDFAKDPAGSKKRTASSTIPIRFGDGVTLDLDLALAQVLPEEEAAASRLRRRLTRDQSGDAKALQAFLSLNRLELDASANTSSPLSFPDKAAGGESEVVRKQASKTARVVTISRVKGRPTTATAKDASGGTNDALTNDMKKGGIVAFAFVRILQMQDRDRINQIKFLLARSLASAPTSSRASSGSDKAEESGSTSREAAMAAQPRDVRSFLSRLVKAFERDADEMEQCLSAMDTHVDSQADSRRTKSETQDIGAMQLPTLQSLINRGFKCLEATQTLAHSTRVLRECLASD
ncbi:hypothetical protein PANT_19c00118 [Moesziomyces antarcticus T-34]|uniref:Uncharacterized protein n=1 Tax=Pseudozyma antarctica (strain T-34) TaxID=1151754 RepID=M9MFF8_PSEA3|nr:hypothetical protein PANT_19c00118 [Moesziomyces antarcticus T-34]